MCCFSATLVSLKAEAADTTNVRFKVDLNSSAMMNAGEYELTFDSKYDPPAVSGEVVLAYIDAGFFENGEERYWIEPVSLTLTINSKAQKTPSALMVERAPTITFESKRVTAVIENNRKSQTNYLMDGKLSGGGFNPLITAVPLVLKSQPGGFSADVNVVLDLKKMGLGPFGLFVFKMIGGHTVEVDMKLWIKPAGWQKIAHQPRPEATSSAPTVAAKLTNGFNRSMPQSTPKASNPKAAVKKQMQQNPGKKKNTLPKKPQTWEDIRAMAEELREKLNRR